MAKVVEPPTLEVGPRLIGARPQKNKASVFHARLIEKPANRQ